MASSQVTWTGVKGEREEYVGEGEGERAPTRRPQKTFEIRMGKGEGGRGGGANVSISSTKKGNEWAKNH